MLKKTVATTFIISLLLTQLAQAAINRDILGGGALGILQCQNIRGNKTKVTWRVIVNDASKPINATHFRYETSSGVVRDVYGAVTPTVDYQTSEVFDGLQKQISLSGEAYNISDSGIYRYFLKKPLNVECN